jgi:hypothetical protein
VKSAEAAQSGGQITTAAGPATDGLDAAYARLRPSDPFDGEQEKRLLAKGWVTPTK